MDELETKLAAEQIIYERAVAICDTYYQNAAATPGLQDALDDGLRLAGFELHDPTCLDAPQPETRIVFAVGEVHYSRKPIDHIHERLVPLIKRNPEDWLILSENYEPSSIDTSPGSFYLREVSKILGTAYDGVVPYFTFPEPRQYICDTLDLDDDTFDCIQLASGLNIHIIMHNALGSRRYGTDVSDQAVQQMIDNALQFDDFTPQLIHDMSKLTNTSTQRTRTLLQRLQEEGVDSYLNERYEQMVDTWNQYIKDDFRRTLAKYPDKFCVLINSGIAHLDAFIPQEE